MNPVAPAVATPLRVGEPGVATSCANSLPVTSGGLNCWEVRMNEVMRRKEGKKEQKEKISCTICSLSNPKK